jgi:hypothetical protein
MLNNIFRNFANGQLNFEFLISDFRLPIIHRPSKINESPIANRRIELLPFCGGFTLRMIGDSIFRSPMLVC